MRVPDPVAERLLDAALELADQGSWEAVRLHAVAQRAGVTLGELAMHLREKEDLVEQWFDRADRTMLAFAQAPDFLSRDTSARLHGLIMAWLGALSGHRRVTREMIVNKFEPGHLHVQIPGLLRVSRTVQWMREAARRDATFVHRAVEEVVLTSIYLAVFTRWMADSSAGSADTSRLLTALLESAGGLSRALYGPGAVAPPHRVV